jgi:hypothetical protein
MTPPTDFVTAYGRRSRVPRRRFWRVRTATARRCLRAAAPVPSGGLFRSGRYDIANLRSHLPAGRSRFHHAPGPGRALEALACAPRRPRCSSASRSVTLHSAHPERSKPPSPAARWRTAPLALMGSHDLARTTGAHRLWRGGGRADGGARVGAAAADRAPTPPGVISPGPGTGLPHRAITARRAPKPPLVGISFHAVRTPEEQARAAEVPSGGVEAAER